MAEDYGLKSFNGIIFGVLAIIAIAVIAAALYIHLSHPGNKPSSTNRTNTPASSTQPQ